MAALAERHKFQDCGSKNITSGSVPLENALGHVDCRLELHFGLLTTYITAYWIEQLIDNLII